MVSRGYDGEVRTMPQAPLAPGQWLVLTTGFGMLALLVIGGFLFWG